MMQATKSPPDVSTRQLPGQYQNLLTFAGNDVRNYPDRNDAQTMNYDGNVRLLGYNISAGTATPAVAPPTGEQEYSPPTPPSTPKQPYQQSRFPSNLANLTDGLNMSPLTVRTDLVTSRGDQLVTPMTSCIHSDPSSVTSPHVTHTPFRDDMESMRQTKQLMTRMLYEAMERENGGSPDYTSVKPFPLQDPPKSKSKYKRQVSTESDDPHDIKSHAKSPTKKLQASAERGYPGYHDINQESCDGGVYSATGEKGLCPAGEATNSGGTDTTAHPYAMNVKWIYSENDPSPKKEEDFTEISVMDEMNKTNSKQVPSVASGPQERASNHRCSAPGQQHRVTNNRRAVPVRQDRDSNDRRADPNQQDRDIKDRRTVPGQQVLVINDGIGPGGEVGHIRGIPMMAEGFSRAADVRHSDTSDPVKSRERSCESVSRVSTELSPLKPSEVVMLAEYKQQINDDLHRDMMLSNIRNRDDRPPSTATTDASNVTDKGWSFPPVARIQDPIPVSPRVVYNRPTFPKEDTPTRTCTENDTSARTASMTSLRTGPMTSPRTTLIASPRTASVLAKHMMPSPAAKEQPEARDKGFYQGELLQKRPTYSFSYSDIDHSPSKQEIERMKCHLTNLYRSISDPTSVSPTKKNLLREERQWIDNFQQYEDDPFEAETLPSRPFIDDDRPYDVRQHTNDVRQYVTRPEVTNYSRYISAGRGQGDHFISESVKRQLFAESNGGQFTPKARTVVSDRWARDVPQEQISDEMAAYLISSKFCTAEDIRSFNEKGQQLSRQGEQYSLSQRDVPDQRDTSSQRDAPSQWDVSGQWDIPSQRDVLSQRDLPSQWDPSNQNYRMTYDWLASRDRQSGGQYRPPPEGATRLQVPQQPTSYRTPSPPNRKRNRAEVDIKVFCEDFRISDKTKQQQENLRMVDHAGKNCACANVESEILAMARDAYRKIRRKDDSKEAFTQFEEEVQDTNAKLYDAMNILCGIKSLCKHGRVIVDIFNGSIVFRIHCPSTLALSNLWTSYESGELTRIVNASFVSESMRGRYPDIHIGLVVSMSAEQYACALAELASSVSPVILDSSLSKSDTEISSITGDSLKENKETTRPVSSASRLAVVHIRSHSAPITNSPSPASSPSWLPKSPRSPLGGDRKFTFPGEPSPRRIVQERNLSSSPTMKKLFDFDLNLSPKTSPKRKTFAEEVPWEHENIYQEVQSPKRKNVGSFPFKDKSNDA